MTILVCPAGAVRVEGGSGGGTLLGGSSMLTPGSCLGGLWRGRCRGVGEGGSSLEGRRRARARNARADNRAPEWSAGGRGWKEGAGAGVRTPPARPCGARGDCASQQRSRHSAFRRRPSARPVRFQELSPLPSPALPPTLRPALRAPRSGPRRRRPQPFILAAASAGVVYWLQQRSPASSRLPTARQVEESARWPGVAS